MEFGPVVLWLRVLRIPILWVNDVIATFVNLLFLRQPDAPRGVWAALQAASELVIRKEADRNTCSTHVGQTFPSLRSENRWGTCSGIFFLRAVVGVCYLAGGISFSHANDAAFYQSKIKPVLHERCYACHGALKQEGGLRLDTAVAAMRGGESGAAVKPSEPDASELLARITSTDLSVRMPPEGEPLKPEQIAAIRQWIAGGATGPADEVPEIDPREHWAFQTPVRPVVPVVAHPEWNANPIDAFIAKKHEQKTLTPQPLADKRTWLRRVSLDLIGLPPTLAEQDAFLADTSPEADITVVNRLLESPQYGERWGRHWMDIWRYSDWWGLGVEVRNSQKHIWHWRDWIVESLNADKGYDQMLREMLAADELYPNDLDKLRGSGFLARQYFKFNRTSWLDETVEHTAKSMLGLTFNCAKCHDHKYDPFSQVNYYEMRAIFEPYQVRTEALPGTTDFEQGGLPRAFDCNLDAETFVHIRGDDRNPDKTRSIVPAFPDFLSLGETQIEPVSLPAEAFVPGLRPFVVEAQRRAAEQKIATAKTALEAARTKLIEAEKAAASPPTEPPMESESMVLAEDNFAAARPEQWESRDGQWSYANGRLSQSLVGPTRTAMRLKTTPPVDFEARLKYIATGGEMWKSVGITFDVGAQGQEVLAYLSSYAGGPKSQVAYKQGAGDYAYPADGAQSRAIDLQQPQEIVLRVRGTLVNLAINGEPSVAYRLPIPRAPGPLELITYDASAEFLTFELRHLPASIKLIDPKNAPNSPDGPKPLDQVQLELQIAEKSLAAVEGELVSLNSRAAADQARYQVPPAESATPLAHTAALAEKQAAASQADIEVTLAELALKQATTEQLADREAKLTAAKTALEAARKAVEMPGETYTSLVGALKTLENNLETEESRRKPFPQTSTGRRSALAKWITDPRHPLPARVAVNHIWARHMGQPLVPTVFDFGRKATRPVHPELLDWLAVELIEHGWSMKYLHRLIVTSRTYRMSSSNLGASETNLVRDPENKFFWRANPIRMEAQTIRDSLLHLAEELDLTLGGPSIPVSDEASRRRSLYFVHSHNEHQKFLSMFDDASVLDCYRRTESIVPQQALALENSSLTNEIAEKIAARIHTAHPDLSESDWIREAFRTILSCEPTAGELNISAAALTQLTQLGAAASHPNPAGVARSQFLQALLNHNDFVTVR